MLEMLFRKILRGWNCGYAILEGDIGVDLSHFPVIPDPQDSDKSVGLWTKEETLWIIERLNRLLESNIPFGPPPGAPDVYPADPSECDIRMRGQIKAVASITDLNYEHVNVLTFIG